MMRAGLAVLLLLLAGPVSAGPVTVRFEGGYVSVSARSASLRDVLAEWTRQGQTRFVNTEKVGGALVTIELVHVPEKQALEVLLRSVAGYVAAPRSSMAGGVSVFDRIVVMPTSSAPPPAPAGGARMPVRPPVFPQPAPPPVVVDDQEEPTGFNLGGPPVLTDMPEDPDEQPLTSPPAPPFGLPQGPDGMPQPIVDPNAPGTQTPVVPGPTPLLPGVLTQPMPGQMPVPSPKPPQ